MILVLIGCLVIGSTSGARLKRMVGSKEISILEAPYQVSLRFNGIHVCGGALISSKHVLTAAHCLDGLFDEPYDELTAVTGTDNLKKGGQVHKVADVKCHPKFVADAKEYYNHDIAVVTLQRDIKLGKTQQALTLPNHDVVNGTSGHVSGFGRTVTLNPYPSTTLRALKATVLTVNACKPFAVDNKILDNQVCGIQERGIGICKGDSGGPLVIDGKLAGIASWNRQEPDGCGSGVPDVYTNVFRYLDFIRLCTKK